MDIRLASSQPYPAPPASHPQPEAAATPPVARAFTPLQLRMPIRQVHLVFRSDFAPPQPRQADTPNSLSVRRFAQGSIDSADLLRLSTSTLRSAASALDCLECMRELYATPGAQLDTALFNTAIFKCAGTGALAIAICLLNDMLLRFVRPDAITFRALLETCIQAGSADEALSLMDFLQRQGPALGVLPDTSIYNLLVKACMRDGRVQEARQIFDHMDAHGHELGIRPTALTYTLLIDGAHDGHAAALVRHGIQRGVLRRNLGRMWEGDMVELDRRFLGARQAEAQRSPGAAMVTAIFHVLHDKHEIGPKTVFLDRGQPLAGAAAAAVARCRAHLGWPDLPAGEGAPAR